MAATIPESSTGLYWNIRGNIRCAQHAQELDLRRWESEVWEPIPEGEEPQRRGYQCQRCSPDGNPIKR
jgi:hypothetical protein